MADESEFSPDIKELQGLLDFDQKVEQHAAAEQKKAEAPPPSSPPKPAVADSNALPNLGLDTFNTPSLNEPAVDGMVNGMVGAKSNPCETCGDKACTARGTGMSTIHCRNTSTGLQGGMVKTIRR